MLATAATPSQHLASFLMTHMISLSVKWSSHCGRDLDHAEVHHILSYRKRVLQMYTRNIRVCLFNGVRRNLYICNHLFCANLLVCVHVIRIYCALGILFVLHICRTWRFRHNISVLINAALLALVCLPDVPDELLGRCLCTFHYQHVAAVGYSVALEFCCLCRRGSRVHVLF